MVKKIFGIERRKDGFPACVTQSGRDSRTGYQGKVKLNPMFRNKCGVLFF
jgi:hypothetical protein